jgi:hypothetical protein
MRARPITIAAGIGIAVVGLLLAVFGGPDAQRGALGVAFWAGMFVLGVCSEMWSLEAIERANDGTDDWNARQSDTPMRMPTLAGLFVAAVLFGALALSAFDDPSTWTYRTPAAPPAVEAGQ